MKGFIEVTVGNSQINKKVLIKIDVIHEINQSTDNYSCDNIKMKNGDFIYPNETYNQVKQLIIEAQ